MSVYVLGVATHPASRSESRLRLEEMAYHTAHAALDDAGVTRRPLGIGATVSDAFFAQAVADEFDIREEEIARRVVNAYARAAKNPRGIKHVVPTVESVKASAFDALPLRSGERAPLTDGAVALVL